MHKNRQIAIAYSIVLMVIVLSFSFLLQYNETVGKVVHSDTDTFVENFDSVSNIGPDWDLNNIDSSKKYTFTDPMLNTQFSGLHMDSSTSMSINYNDLKLNSQSGSIWFRIKLDNDNYDQSEFLPIFAIGGIFLFKGSAVEGEGISSPITNGNDIFIGSPGDYTKIGTWNKGEWHEVFIQWSYIAQFDSYSINVYVDGEFKPSADSNGRYTLGYAADDFPVDSSNNDLNNIYFMPPLSLVEDNFPNQNLEIKSGFFIDKFITSKSDPDDFRQIIDLDESIIPNNPLMWDNMPGEINVAKGSSDGTVIISDIVQKCLVWNSQENGILSIDNAGTQGYDLEIIGDDLLINNLDPALETLQNIYITCTYDSEIITKLIPLKIGDPIIFDFYFIENNQTSVSAIMEKNSQKNIVFYVNDLRKSKESLDYQITGNSVVGATINKAASTLAINSGATPVQEETIHLTITNNDTQESKTGTITIMVLGDNQAPVISAFSPQESTIQLEKGNSINFTQTSSDTRTPTNLLSYKWYVDNQRRSTSSFYSFTTTSSTLAKSYIIKLEVLDQQGLKSSKNWTVNVYSPQIKQNTTNTSGNTSNNNDIQYLCGNNRREPGEECDGDYSDCNGYMCFSDCTCYIPEINSSCTPSWNCTEWSSCQYGFKTRMCRDSNNCNNLSSKPSDMETCTTQAQATTQQNGQNTQTTIQNNQGTSSSGSSSNNQGAQNQANTATTSSSTKSQQNEKTTDKNTDKKTIKNKVNAKEKESEKLSPEDSLIKNLLWALGIISLIPFILIAVGRLSPQKNKKVAYQKPKNARFDHDKLLNIVNWYKGRGMNAQSAYNMLLRMGFDQRHAYHTINEIYYNRK